MYANRSLLTRALLTPLLLLSGCDPDTFVGGASLDSLANSGQAVVRIYAAPIPNIELIAIHPWFVVKPANSTTFHRWEVWQSAGGPYDHVRLDLHSLTADVGGGDAFIIGELIGFDAEAVVSFIEQQSPVYPCRESYFFLGPNSNTYPQWVLDNTGWNISLPARAIGKDWRGDCL